VISIRPHRKVFHIVAMLYLCDFAIVSFVHSCGASDVTCCVAGLQFLRQNARVRCLIDPDALLADRVDHSTCVTRSINVISGRR